MADKLDTLLKEDDSKIEIHPEEYFNAVKERKNTITDERPLDNIFLWD